MNLKKLSFYIICIFANFSLCGQWSLVEEVDLKWKETSYQDNENKLISSETFEGSIPNDKNIPTYHLRINIPIKGELNVTLEDVVIEKSKFYTTHNLESNWNIEYLISQQGSSVYANISVTPLRKSKNTIERLSSFRLNISLKPSLESVQRGPIFKTKSILAEGDFYKIAVDKTGVFSLSGSDLRDNLNIDITTLDPQKLKIFVGNTGRLAESLNDDRIDDLVETPAELIGTADGSFNENDQIRFFAFGPDHWLTNQTDEELQYTFVKNIYSTVSYVYLQTNGDQGLRISQKESPNNSTYTSSDYDFLQIYGEDKVNLLGAYNQTEGTGQIWYSDYFGSNTEQDYTSKFDFTGHVNSKEADIQVSMAARSKTFTSSNLTIGNNQINSSYPGTTTSSIESAYARPAIKSEKILIENNPNIKIEYIKSNSVDEAWLDYLQIINRRSVDIYNSQTIIQDRKSIDHSVAGFSGNIPTGFVWNVTEPDDVHIVTVNNGWNYETEDKLQRFIAFSSTLAPSGYEGKVENQNLHGIQDVDLIIMHPTEFTEQAERLAAHRRSTDGYLVETIDVNLIYNEFSGGKQDVTALRDFAKMLHDRTENFRYLLLLGDGSYDHRNLNTSVPDHNFVPAYETKQSLHPIEGFPTDDFFGLLSDDEGGSLSGDMDIAVGRIPVETSQQAEDIIDKIITYDTGKNRFGDWRLRVGFAADDQDGNQHLNQNESLADFVRTNYPVYNQKKIYFDAFEQLSTPGGERFPDASESINNSVQDGQLILNYLGHGGPNGWAQERVLKLSDIDSWNNRDQLPLLITATCTFTGFDDPEIVSAGEYAMRKKNGGCIALMTTVRAVYSRDNKALADVVFENLFERDDLKSLTMGDVLKLAKNSITSNSTTINSRKFLLIGDPSMRLALPNDNIVTTHINDDEIGTSEIDTIKALETVKISGMITDQEGNLVEDFNGTIYPTVYDKESTIETLGNDSGSSKVKFEVFKNVIFKGAASVTNGLWSFEFVVPQDINYQFGHGRISYYADNDNNNDASGYFEDIIVGGSSDDIVGNDKGPSIDLFMDNESFLDGGDVQKNTTLIVNLSDDLGINVSGNSIGHDLTATLDDGQQFILNDFYKSNVNNFKTGQALFPLNNLSPGLHSIKVKAWDVTNNSAEAIITFNVVEFIDGNVVSTSIFPNPFKNDATIVFDHDLGGQDVELAIQFYNTQGQFIHEEVRRASLDGTRTELPISTSGNKLDDLPTGLYFYKIKLTSNELSNSVESDFEKFVIVD